MDRYIYAEMLAYILSQVNPSVCIIDTFVFSPTLFICRPPEIHMMPCPEMVCSFNLDEYECIYGRDICFCQITTVGTSETYLEI